MIADGGLPRSFDDVLEVLRGVRLLTGLGRIRVGAKNARDEGRPVRPRAGAAATCACGAAGRSATR